MFIIRPAQEEDFAKLQEIANTAQGIITSLSKDPVVLRQLLNTALASFTTEKTDIRETYYLFVLSDITTNEMCGISAIRPFSYYDFFYQIKEGMLTFLFSNNSPTELGSLYILPPYRKGGYGKLLSLARLHFIATFPARFKTNLMANMRGYLDETKHSPFWESVGKKAMNITYEEAEELIINHDTQREKLVIQHPFPISSLPKMAQDVIGKVHPNTLPALHLLQSEGFRWKGVIDVIDGGPRLDAVAQEVPLIKNSRLLKVQAVLELPSDTPSCLISNNRLDFRACMAPVKQDALGVQLNPETANALQVQVGDLTRI